MASPPEDKQPSGLGRSPLADDLAPAAAPPTASVEEAPPGSDEPPRGRFVRPPTPGELSQIRKLITSTGRPEDIPALSTSKPDKTIEHILFLPEIEINRSLRLDGDMVPCAFCSGGHPKTLKPFLLWSADGHLRLVGPICGPKYFGQAEYREMHSAAKAANLKRANTDLLLDHLGAAHLLLEDAKTLVESCRRFELLRNAFMNRIPKLHQRLRHEVQEHGNALAVYVEVNSDTPAGFRSSVSGEKSRMEVRQVATLRGPEFLMPSYNANAKAAAIKTAVENLMAPYTSQISDDQVLERLEYMNDVELAAAVKNLRAAHDGARKLLAWLQSARGFLAVDNVDALDAWSSDERNDFNLRVGRVAGGVIYRCGAESVRLPLAGSVRIPQLEHLGLPGL